MLIFFSFLLRPPPYKLNLCDNCTKLKKLKKQIKKLKKLNKIYIDNDTDPQEFA